jgi:hypothetical protein
MEQSDYLALPVQVRWPRLKPRPGYRLSYLRLHVVFLHPSTQMMIQYIKLGHRNFLPYPFQFIIHPTIRRYAVRVTDTVPKWITKNHNHRNYWLWKWNSIKVAISFCVYTVKWYSTIKITYVDESNSISSPLPACLRFVYSLYALTSKKRRHISAPHF